ncbi:MAG: glycosyltransferase family 39 protein [Candidatus Peribacteraceae bacterium]|nr:glycosyltransferase family 39 protein [Candidatus Peribacteraceae bacterium]
MIKFPVSARFRFLVDTFSICLVLLGIIATWFFAIPNFSNSKYQIADEQPIEFSMPLYFESINEKLAVVSTQMHLSFFHFSKYRISADDCIEFMRINDKVVIDEENPLCGYYEGKVFNLSEHIKSGDNEIIVFVHNNGGPATFNIEPHVGDILMLLLISILLGSISLYFLRLKCFLSFPKAFLFLIFFGVALRILYTAGTPYDVRAHDVSGHIEYVHFIIENYKLPHVGDGWEWYQPPLYYVLLSPVSLLTRNISILEPVEYLLMQCISLVLSILSLFVLFLIGREIFPRKAQIKQKLFFIAFLSVFPGLIYFASRINNDVLFAFLGFASIYCLLKWWKENGNIWWYSSILLISLGLLSKSNSILLLAFAGSLFIFARHIYWKDKIKMAIKSGVILLLLTEWLFVFRWLGGDTMSLVGNVATLNSGLLVENSFINFVTFNPIAILEYPFADAWNDEFRRGFFLEFLYKSSFFGEFKLNEEMHPLASSILLVNLLTFPLFIWGIIKSIKNNLYSSLPMIFLFLIFILGHTVFRFNYPYSSSQDFRYSILLLVPIFYFLITGWEKSNVSVRKAYILIFITFIVLCGIFDVWLSLN